MIAAVGQDVHEFVRELAGVRQHIGDRIERTFIIAGTTFDC